MNLTWCLSNTYEPAAQEGFASREHPRQDSRSEVEFSKIKNLREIQYGWEQKVQRRLVRGEANSVSGDRNMKGLISLGKKVGLYPTNKAKPLTTLKKESDVPDSVLEQSLWSSCIDWMDGFSL